MSCLAYNLDIADKYLYSITMDLLERKIDSLVKAAKLKWHNITSRLAAYFRRLIFPLYAFPIKLVTYSAYYLVKFTLHLVFTLIRIVFEVIIYPFRGIRNFLKSLFILGVVAYMAVSLFVIADYLRTQYGFYGKFLCSIGAKDRVRGSVVRIVGGYSEGTGFFITQNQILTNFHVIADEPSPKIVLPDGSFITPIKIVGDKDADLAILTTTNTYPDYVMPLPSERVGIYKDEPLIATGYPLGTELVGESTTVKGNFIAYRQSKQNPMVYIQTDVSLVNGMSGGPLTDQCGSVVGINTMSLAGLSLFISADQAQRLIPNFTDQNITKINVDPSKSPEDAVIAFYTYLKARRMEDGFSLLSTEYLKKTNFTEWTNRFTDILDVDVIKAERVEGSKDTAFVKFSTKNWVDDEAQMHFYEGTWQTIPEEGVYKMLKSKITEVDNPELGWFYE